MRLLRTIFTMAVIMALALAALPLTAFPTPIRPISFGNSYPATAWSNMGVTGPVTGRVVYANNTSAGIANCYVSIVNASNQMVEYANGTTDASGNFTFNGLSATFSSVLGAGPDGTAGSLGTGRAMYMVYAYKDGLGRNYSASFGIDANGSGPARVTLILPASPGSVMLTADPYIQVINGVNCTKIIAVVTTDYDDPVADGTGVDFSITKADWSYRDGNLNGNNSQFATAATENGRAVVYYGWLPGNKLPDKNVTIVAYLNRSRGLNGVMDVYFSWIKATPTPVPSTAPGASGPSAAPTATGTPVLVTTPTAVPVNATATATSPSPTPVSPAITLLAMIAGMAAAAYVRKKT